MNVKAVVAVFNQKKALVGAFSIIVKLQTSRRFVSSCNQDLVAMFWRLLVMKLLVDVILLALLTHDGWSFFTQTRKMIFICQHGLRSHSRPCLPTYLSKPFIVNSNILSPALHSAPSHSPRTCSNGDNSRERRWRRRREKSQNDTSGERTPTIFNLISFDLHLDYIFAHFLLVNFLTFFLRIN